MIKLSAIHKRLRNKFTEFNRNKDGVAAIEFAFVAPVMIAFYFGLAETTLAITKDRNVAHTASVAGDLATQVATLDKPDVEDIFTAALSVLDVNTSEHSDVTIELQSFKMRTDGSGTIDRIGYARVGPQITGAEMTSFHPSKLSKNMLNETSGAVVARVTYRYKPNTLMFVSNMVLGETFVLKPRRSLAIPFDDAGVQNFICSANTDRTISC